MIQEFCCSRGTLSRAQVGACLTLRNQLSEETHMLTKHEALLGRGAWAESRRVGNPGGGSVMWLAISGSMVKGWRACVAQPRWMPTRRICGGGGTQDTWPHGVSSQISSSWWWLVSAVFLTRPSWL